VSIGAASFPTHHTQSHPQAPLSQSSHPLSVGLVQPKRNNEFKLAAGRNAPPVVVSKDGLHSLRPDRRRRAAGLVTAHEQAARLSPAVLTITPPQRGYHEGNPACGRATVVAWLDGSTAHEAGEVVRVRPRCVLPA
jgi:hypothetical protein